MTVPLVVKSQWQWVVAQFREDIENALRYTVMLVLVLVSRHATGNSQDCVKRIV